MRLPMRYDFQVVGEMSQGIQIFKILNKEVLLLGGTRSPGYFKRALSALGGTLLNVSRRTSPDSIIRLRGIQTVAALH